LTVQIVAMLTGLGGTEKLKWYKRGFRPRVPVFYS